MITLPTNTITNEKWKNALSHYAINNVERIEKCELILKDFSIIDNCDSFRDSARPLVQPHLRCSQWIIMTSILLVYLVSMWIANVSTHSHDTYGFEKIIKYVLHSSYEGRRLNHLIHLSSNHLDMSGCRHITYLQSTIGHSVIMTIHLITFFGE